MWETRAGCPTLARFAVQGIAPVHTQLVTSGAQDVMVISWVLRMVLTVGVFALGAALMAGLEEATGATGLLDATYGLGASEEAMELAAELGAA